MPQNDLNMEVSQALFKSVSPIFTCAECFDFVNGTVIGPVANFLVKNRGGSNSLCDSVFQVNYKRMNYLNRCHEGLI